MEETIKKQHEAQVKRIASNGYTTKMTAYPDEQLIIDPNIRLMDEIHEMSVSGRTIIEAMGINNMKPSWEDILILAGQLDTMPLSNDNDVNIKTVIGKNSDKPLVIEGPVYVSHMSFGALSREAKEALAKGSSRVKTAVGSGEGGILPEEIDNSYKYIFEYVPHEYNVTDENLRRADAIEIKIGQGTKPGIGGFFPGEIITDEIGAVRNIKADQRVTEPVRFSDINNKYDLKAKVDSLRSRSRGRPIGIKIAPGRIEKDLEVCVYAGADFVTIDGRGGATAASPKVLRDAVSLPTIYALHRGRKYLDSVRSDISLIITGGLRVSSDFAKAIAMGADAVAIGTAPLMAIGCQQHRLCSTGNCPTGIATQNPDLRERLDVEKSAQRLENFLNVSFNELRMFARICGKHDVHKLNIDDLCTVDSEISNNTNIRHA